MFLVFHDNLRLAVLINFVLLKNNECRPLHVSKRQYFMGHPPPPLVR